MLDLRGLRLGGSLPASICKLIHLETLDLSATSLEGNIPTNLDDLIELKHLFLSGNPKLHGYYLFLFSSNCVIGTLTENIFKADCDKMIDIQGSSITIDRLSVLLRKIALETREYIQQMQLNRNGSLQINKPSKLLKINSSELKWIQSMSDCSLINFCNILFWYCPLIYYSATLIYYSESYFDN